MSRIRSLLQTVALFAFVQTASQTLASTAFIPSGSMEPSLQVGDVIGINRLAYGLHVPFTTDVELARWGIPQRGDVVVFNVPKAGDASESMYIKRVLALPGERISVQNHQVLINGKRLSYQKVAAGFVETAGAHTHKVLVGPSALEDMAEVIVPEGSVFVMGDHRNNSSDSRAWGFVPLERIRGRVSTILVSFNTSKIRALASIDGV